MTTKEEIREWAESHDYDDDDLRTFASASAVGLLVLKKADVIDDESMDRAKEMYETMYEMFDEEEFDPWAEEYVRGLMLARPFDLVVDSYDREED